MLGIRSLNLSYRPFEKPTMFVNLGLKSENFEVEKGLEIVGFIQLQTSPNPASNSRCVVKFQRPT